MSRPAKLVLCIQSSLDIGEFGIHRGAYLKGYVVFNACQIDGIEFAQRVPFPPPSSSKACEAARRIVEGMPQAPVIHEGRHAQAFYDLTTDSVNMPARATFLSEPSFFKTIFHELVHAMAAAHRLARPSLLGNDDADARANAMRTYSQEELVAEMGAAFLAAHAEILDAGQMEDSAAYLQGWLSVLKDTQNRKWLVRAASQAQKAAHFILGE